MADLPSLQFFPAAYLADTHPDLSLEEHGCYCLLLWFAWLTPNKMLPDDDAWIAKRLAIHPLKWKHLRPLILERFWTLETTDRGRYWYQKKLRSVGEWQAELRRKRVDAASVSVSVRQSKSNKTNGISRANGATHVSTSSLVQSSTNLNSTAELVAASGSSLATPDGARSPTAAKIDRQLRPGTVRVECNTPQWRAWIDYLDKPPPVVNQGWYFESEWPP